MKSGAVKKRVLDTYGQSAPIVNNEPLESTSPLFVTFEVKVNIGNEPNEPRLIKFMASTVDLQLVPSGYFWDFKIEERDEFGTVRLIHDHVLCNPRSLAGLSDTVHGHKGKTLIFTLTASGSVRKLTWSGYRYYPRITFRAFAA